MMTVLVAAGKVQQKPPHETFPQRCVKYSGKRKQNYSDHLRYKSKINCLIHSPGHLSDECKVLNDFGDKYAKGRDFGEHRKGPISNKTFGKKQEINYIIQNEVEEIILQETEKLNLTLKIETHENIYDKVNEQELYDMDKLILDEKK